MKKAALIIILSLTFTFIGCVEKSADEKEILSNKNVEYTQKFGKIENVNEYTYENALANGYVIRKTTFNGEEEEDKIYNKSVLDKFIKSIKEGEKDNFVLAEYLNKNGNLIINKLSDFSYDGHNII